MLSIGEDERLDRINENLTLIQKKNGLTFGTDAYLLAAFLRPSPQSTAIELGAGTGVISLLAAARGKYARMEAVEIQPCFADLIARNAEANALSDRVFSRCADLRNLRASDFGGEVPVVFSNPPYMTVDSGRKNEAEEKYLARHEVCGGIVDFCAAAARLTRFGGSFYTVYRPDRLTDLFCALRAHRLEPKRMVEVCADIHRAPCMVLLESRRGGAPGLVVLPPLFLAEHGRPTPRATAIYDACQWCD